MANPTQPEHRQARLKRWAEADYEDEKFIAEARKRIRLREIERLDTLDDSESNNGRPDSNASYRDEEADLGGPIKQDEDDGNESAANNGMDQAYFTLVLTDESQITCPTSTAS
jgi:hypothetical protein